MRIYLGTSSSLHLKLIKGPRQTSPHRGGFNITITNVILCPSLRGRGWGEAVRCGGGFGVYKQLVTPSVVAMAVRIEITT